MSTSDLVELVAGGARVLVPRSVGFELFERNRDLIVEGRVETVQVELSGSPRSVLHLVLGAGPVSVIEPAEVVPKVGPAALNGSCAGSSPVSGDGGVLSEGFFPNFDYYA